MNRESEKLDLALLGALREQGGDYLSGESLAELLGLSRVSVKARLDRLRGQGFGIEAIRNRGYSLTEEPLTLHPLLLELELSGLGLQLPWELLESCASTNDEAMRRLTEIPQSPLVVVTRRQSSGRGRLGRHWHSDDDGNLMLSFGFRPNRQPSFMQRFTVLVGLRLAARLSRETELEIRAKWPNDLLLNGRKLAGILTEARLDADRMRELILGLGLNVNSEVASWPLEVRKIATSLSEAAGKRWSMNRITALVIDEVTRAYATYLDNDIGAELDSLWNQYSAISNREVTIAAAEGNVSGTVLGLDETGALRLRLDSGFERAFSAGDVSLHGIYNE